MNIFAWKAISSRISTVSCRNCLLNTLAMSYGDGRGERTTSSKEPVEPWWDKLEASMAQIRHIKGSNYIQMATTDAENMATCRTVVFRGVISRSRTENGAVERAFRIITDRRSCKLSHIEKNPHAELVWWMSHTSEQYRFTSIVDVISSNHTNDLFLQDRYDMWQELSGQAQEQFYWPVSGTPYDSKPDLIDIPSSHTEEGPSSPPDSFVLLLVYPHRVHYLRLTDHYAQWDVQVGHHVDSEGVRTCVWQRQRVNP